MKLSVLCYVTKNGKTLMLHRVKKESDLTNGHYGKWNGLGGKIEHNESPEEAVKREVFEESGLTIKKPVLKGIITCPETSTDEEWIIFIFIAKKFKGNLIECNEGDLEWVKTSEIKKLNLWQADYLLLPLLNKKGIFTAKITYDNGKVIHSIINKYK
ncbi:NUDIX domain protein [uncultured archaeon]|nr:NUDIX domain protein [uncultured archaeon]